jgi:hypothetical protein
MKPIDPPFDVPDTPLPAEDSPDPSDLDDWDCPIDDTSWDVFIPEDDERDPLPDAGDFWGIEPGTWGEEPD